MEGFRNAAPLPEKAGCIFINRCINFRRFGIEIGFLCNSGEDLATSIYTAELTTSFCLLAKTPKLKKPPAGGSFVSLIPQFHAAITLCHPVVAYHHLFPGLQYCIHYSLHLLLQYLHQHHQVLNLAHQDLKQKYCF